MRAAGCLRLPWWWRSRSSASPNAHERMTRPLPDSTASTSCRPHGARGRSCPAGTRLARSAAFPARSPVVLVAALARRLPQRVLVVVTPTPTDAERWLADAQALPGRSPPCIPSGKGWERRSRISRLRASGLETVEALLSGRCGSLVTTARASAERTGVPAALRSKRLDLDVGRVTDAGEGKLAERRGPAPGRGWDTRASTVTEVGQFGVHGGIIDDVRVRDGGSRPAGWWGDEVVSLRSFDLDTQRSGDGVARVTILPVKTEEGRARDRGTTPQCGRPCWSCCRPMRCCSSRRSRRPSGRSRARGKRQRIISRWPGVWGGDPRARGVVARAPGVAGAGRRVCATVTR